MKKSLSLVLVLSLLISVLSLCTLTATAAGASVTAKVADGSSYNVPTADKLALLVDGDKVSDATAFGTAGLVGFENTGFTHTDGVEAAVEATIELVLDLGATKAINKTYISFFKDSNSMIALPQSIVFEGSTDGDCWFNLNANGNIAVSADIAEKTVADIACDFSSRAVFEVRYVKATITIKNGWFFASEFGVAEATEIPEGTVTKFGGPYTYEENTLPSPGIGIFTEAGDYDLSSIEEGRVFKSAQVVIGKKDSTGKYIISFNKVNPWPDGHAETVTIGADEVLIAVQTDGTFKNHPTHSGAKWALRGLNVGDYFVIDEDAKTVAFYPIEHPYTPSAKPSTPSTDKIVNNLISKDLTWTATDVDFGGSVGKCTYSYDGDKLTVSSDINWPNITASLGDGIVVGADDEISVDFNLTSGYVNFYVVLDVNGEDYVLYIQHSIAPDNISASSGDLAVQGEYKTSFKIKDGVGSKSGVGAVPANCSTLPAADSYTIKSVTIMPCGGNASLTFNSFTVTSDAPASENPPATGDTAMVFALIAIVAMAGAVVVAKKAR